MMRKMGIFLLVCGVAGAAGYLFYWIVRVATAFVPLPLRVAVAIVGAGLVLIVISLVKERWQAYREERFKEIER